jgi:hypothetical protein
MGNLFAAGSQEATGMQGRDGDAEATTQGEASQTTVTHPDLPQQPWPRGAAKGSSKSGAGPDHDDLAGYRVASDHEIFESTSMAAGSPARTPAGGIIPPAPTPGPGAPITPQPGVFRLAGALAGATTPGSFQQLGDRARSLSSRGVSLPALMQDLEDDETFEVVPDHFDFDLEDNEVRTAAFSTTTVSQCIPSAHSTKP